MAAASFDFLQLPPELRNNIYGLIVASQEAALVHSDGMLEVKHPLMLVNKLIHYDFIGMLQHQVREQADFTTTVLNFDFQGISRFLARWPASLRRNRKLTITIHVAEIDFSVIQKYIDYIVAWVKCLGKHGDAIVIDYNLHAGINWYACWEALSHIEDFMSSARIDTLRQAISNGLRLHVQEDGKFSADIHDRTVARFDVRRLEKELRWARRGVRNVRWADEEVEVASVGSGESDRSRRQENGRSVAELREELEQAKGRVARIEERIRQQRRGGVSNALPTGMSG